MNSDEGDNLWAVIAPLLLFTMWNGDIMLTKAICLIVTDKCNAKCDICYFKCAPERRNVIDEQFMLDVIGQAAEISGVEYIGFSGGEPFLFQDILKAGISCARGKNLKTSIATNGFWGKWPEERIANLLRELRPDRISISTDYYHSRFISYEALAKAIKIPRSMGIQVDMCIGETKEGMPADKHFQNMGDYKYSIDCTLYPFFRLGRAKDIAEDAFYRHVDPAGARCKRDGLVSVRFDGEVFPCCNPFVFETPLSIGNLKRRNLAEILEDEYANELFTVLSVEGFAPLIEVAGRECESSFSRLCTSECEVCNALFHDKNISKQLETTVKELFGRIGVDNLLGRPL
jgi:MoaA/NifB/PqqE/SkfB family radical SAM enzyme